MERYGKEVGPEGAVVHCKFILNGQEFIAKDSHENMGMNFNPALSMVVDCETQDEIDFYWDRLKECGFEGTQQCGWLQDKFSISWQIVSSGLGELLNDPAKSGSVMQAMLKMKKLDLNILMQAYHIS